MAEQFVEKANTSKTEDTLISFEDFVEQYEGQAVEWHAGKVVKKVSNNPQHNFITFFLAQVLSFYLAYKSLGKVLTDGVSMYINDEVPARQPDVIVLLNDRLDQIKKTRLEGAADIVVEVVSPGSNSVDRGEKFDEYEAAGVQEYWLIDPVHQEAFVYALNQDGSYRHISTKDKLISQVLPEFSIDISVLWQDELPAGPELVEFVQQMLN